MSAKHACRYLLLLIAGLLLPMTMFADNLVFQLGPGQSECCAVAGIGLGQGVSSTDFVTVTGMAFDLYAPSGGDFKFFIVDTRNMSTVWQEIITVSPASAPDWIVSAPFLLAFQPGQSFLFAFVADSPFGLSDIAPPINYSADNLVANLFVEDYAGFDHPIIVGNGHAQMSLRLYGTGTAIAPESGTLALFTGGLLCSIRRVLKFPSEIGNKFRR